MVNNKRIKFYIICSYTNNDDSLVYAYPNLLHVVLRKKYISLKRNAN